MSRTTRSPRHRSAEPGSGPAGRRSPPRGDLSREALLELEIVERLAERGCQARESLPAWHYGGAGGYTREEKHNALRRLKRRGLVVSSGRGQNATWRLAFPGLWREYDGWAD